MTSNSESFREGESLEEIKKQVKDILISAHDNKNLRRKHKFNEIKLEIVEGICDKKLYKEIANKHHIRPQQVESLASEIFQDLTVQLNKKGITGQVNKTNFFSR